MTKQKSSLRLFFSAVALLLTAMSAMAQGNGSAYLPEV
jgi:hypothetical protein